LPKLCVIAFNVARARRLASSSGAPSILRSVEALTLRLTRAAFVPPVHPGEFDFAAWLDERAPVGAMTLEVAPPGGRAMRLPVVRPPALPPAPRRGRRRLGAAPALHAAFLVDLAGLTHRELARSRKFEFTTERAARQHVRDGRFVAAELGLWPWAVVGGQPLARSWWVDERFASALRRWAGGEAPA
jgi:hypothetical protein